MGHTESLKLKVVYFSKDLVGFFNTFYFDKCTGGLITSINNKNKLQFMKYL